MGLLVEGKWQNQWYDTKSSGGRFERKAPSFRNWITKDGIAGTVAMDYIKAHYYGSHETINPTRIIPSGPLIDFNTAHGREQFSAEKQSKKANLKENNL